MTGERGRHRAAKKHGLSGCHVDHQGLFRPINIPYPSSLPPTNVIGVKLDLVLPQRGTFSGGFFLVDLVLPHCNVNV